MVSHLIARALDTRVVRATALAGGCVGEVYRVELDGGDRVVAKVGGGALDVEGFMLRYLAEHSELPVPAVRFAAPELLVMEWLPGASHFDAAAEVHAAALLAQLHDHAAPEFGLSRDTLIGGLRQPNARSRSWLAFFAERRLLYMTREAVLADRLDPATAKAIERLAGRLDRWLAEPAAPALLHGDVWSGNVLAESGRITGFVDPAIYFGDPEIELAFITLFHCFGERFFAAYGERRPIAAGFFEERRHLYNLYPLLVHARLFGGGYAGDVRRTVVRFS